MNRREIGSMGAQAYVLFVLGVLLVVSWAPATASAGPPEAPVLVRETPTWGRGNFTLAWNDLTMEVLDSRMPWPLMSTSAIWTNETAYIFPGEDGLSWTQDPRQIVAFDPAGGEVSRTPTPMSMTWYGSSAVWTGRYAYVFGGESGSIYNMVWRFDPVNETIQELPERMPTERRYTAAVWDGEYAYIFGGYDGTYLDQILRFDPVNETITTLEETLPWGLEGASAVWDGEFAYIFGGWNPTVSDQVIRFHPDTGEVKVLDGYMPGARVFSTAVVAGSKAYVIGGFRGGYYLDEIMEFDLQSEVSELFPYRLPGPLCCASSIWDGDRIYIFGGGQKTATTEILSFDPGPLNYVMEESSEPNFGSSVQYNLGRATNYTFTNKPDGTYYYRLMAETADGDSSWTYVLNVTVDVDRDDDGFLNDEDDFPDDSTQWLDSDGDGFGDNPNGTRPDACPEEWGTSNADRYGCIDFDEDGYSNDNDAFPGVRTQWSDSDGDGYGDNPSGFEADTCPDVFGTSHLFVNGTERVYGCPDEDGDGVHDAADPFPGDPSQFADSDGDGYGDNPMGRDPDAFPLDPTEWSDIDGDGIGDNTDLDGNNNGVPDMAEIPLLAFILAMPVLIYYLTTRHIRAAGDGRGMEETGPGQAYVEKTGVDVKPPPKAEDPEEEMAAEPPPDDGG